MLFPCPIKAVKQLGPASEGPARNNLYADQSLCYCSEKKTLPSDETFSLSLPTKASNLTMRLPWILQPLVMSFLVCSKLFTARMPMLNWMLPWSSESESVYKDFALADLLIRILDFFQRKKIHRLTKSFNAASCPDSSNSCPALTQCSNLKLLGLWPVRLH